MIASHPAVVAIPFIFIWLAGIWHLRYIWSSKLLSALHARAVEDKRLGISVEWYLTLNPVYIVFAPRMFLIWNIPKIVDNARSGVYAHR